MHFRVEVQAAEEHPSSSFVYTTPAAVALGVGLGIGKHGSIVGFVFTNDGFQFGFNEGLHFGSTCLFGLFRRNHGGERHVAESIHEQIVVECAQEAYFCGHHCIVVGEVFEVLVAVSDTYAKTIVVATQHRVAGIISVVAIGGNTVVTPSAVSFIGGELVAVPHLTEEAGCTAVNTVHIAVAVGTAITGKTEVGVALVEQLFSFNVGLHRWVNRVNMQVVQTRC